MGASALAFVAIGTVIKDEIAHSKTTSIVPEDKSRFCLIRKQKQTQYFCALNFSALGEAFWVGTLLVTLT